MAKLRPSKDKLTLGTAISLAVLCLAVGSVCISGIYWNVPIERQEAIQLTCNYQKYELIELRNDTLKLYFEDNRHYFVHERCISSDLIENIEALSVGTELEVLLHPRSNDIIALKVDEKNLLDFEYTRGLLTIDEYSFFIFALCMYVSSVCFIVYSVKQARQRIKLNQNERQKK